MKLNMTFTLTVETKRFEIGNDQDTGENVDLELVFDTLEAGMFLFKIARNIFEYKDYKVLIQINHNTGEVNGVSLNDGKKVYIVRSTQQFYIDLLDGYEKIRLLEKMSAIAEYAEFQFGAPTEEEILDEFDE